MSCLSETQATSTPSDLHLSSTSKSRDHRLTPPASWAGQDFSSAGHKLELAMKTEPPRKICLHKIGIFLIND